MIKGKKTKAKGNNRKRPSLVQRKNENQKKKRKNKFLFFIDRNHLMGKGIGFVDAHLLASAQLTGVPLRTADKRLKSAADQLELTFK